MILCGELAPGTRVAEAPLAQRLGMSRTPIRQALPVLAQDDLLAVRELRGYVVRGISSTQILDAIDLRGVLEGVAARRVAERGAPQELLRALRSCLEEGDALLAEQGFDEQHEVCYAEMNARFHEFIVRAASSLVLEQALDRIGAIAFAAPHALAFEKSHLRTYSLITYAHGQHHAIVAALERGEGARVEALMREHSNPVKESLNLPNLRTERRTSVTRLAIVG